MDRYICLVSHEITLDDGGFRKFVAGTAYGGGEIPGEISPVLFRPLVENNEEVKAHE